MEENRSPEEQLAHSFGTFVNQNSVDSSAIAAFMNEMSREHRTLQQQVVHMMIRVLIEYGKQDERFIDGRNEAAHKMCKRLGELADTGEFIPYMPLI